MRDVSLPGQIFSLLTVAIMISSAWIVYMQNEEDLELTRVPVWARSQMPYDTTQGYSFVLQQGEYEILETENEFNSEHVYVEYELPLSELGAAATCAVGGECPKISLAYWRPKVPAGVKVPVIAEFGPYFGETSAGTPDVTTPGSWLGMGIIQNLLPHGFAFAQVSVTGTGMSNHCMDLMGFAEQEGINAAVEWLGTQEWSNGNVGLIGKSYDGSTPWQAAMYGDEYLKTIVPISGLIGVRELMWKNGSSEARAPFMHNVVYGSYGYEVEKQEDNFGNACPDYAASTFYGAEAYVFGGNEFVDGYWAERYFLDRVLENYRGSVYIVQGFHDWNVDPHMAVPTINTLLDHGIEAKVLMGQWDHDYPDRPDYQKQRSDPGRGSEAYPQMVRFDWMQDLLEWFTYYLQETGPKPSLYLEIQDNRGEWRVEDRYPASDSKTIEMILGSEDLVHDAGSGNTITPFADDFIIFETPAFNQTFRFGGLPQLHIDVTLGGNGGSVYALMEDCDSNDVCIHIGHSTMDLRYHAGGTEYHVLSTGEIVNAKMEFFAMDVLIPEGHRIRLSLTDIGDDYLPPSNTAPVEIGINENSILRLHEINVDNKNFFEPPICMHTDCLEE
jgi:predicted acyl esterase